jgi:hypothetical protein
VIVALTLVARVVNTVKGTVSHSQGQSYMTLLKKVRDFLKDTREEFINSTDIDFSECVLVFGNESTGTKD